MKIEKGWLVVIAELAVALSEILKRQPHNEKKEGEKK